MIMNSEYFERYFNEAFDTHNLSKANKLYLCVEQNNTIVWNSSTKRLLIDESFTMWSFSLDTRTDEISTRVLQIIFNNIENKKWNKIGNPIKTELLAHLRQLYELDGAFTKAAKKSI